MTNELELYRIDGKSTVEKKITEFIGQAIATRSSRFESYLPEAFDATSELQKYLNESVGRQSDGSSTRRMRNQASMYNCPFHDNAGRSPPLFSSPLFVSPLWFWPPLTRSYRIVSIHPLMSTHPHLTLPFPRTLSTHPSLISPPSRCTWKPC